MGNKPSAMSEAGHAHLVQFGPSSGLYHTPQGRRRGRNAQPTARELREGAPAAGTRRAGPNPLLDFKKAR